MKLSHLFFSLVFLSVINSALNGQNLVPCNTIDPQTKEKKWGFCDCFYADVSIKCQYDTTFPFTEGLGRVRQNGKYGFVDKTGKLVIPVKYEGADAFTEGFAAVFLDGNAFFIDKKGIDIFKKRFKAVSAFSEGLALCSNEEGKRGFMDAKGNMVIPFNLEAAYPFKNGLAPVRFAGEKNWKAINLKGETAFAFPDKVKTVAGSFSDGLAMVYVDGPAGSNMNYDFVNAKGEFICDAPYASAQPFKNGRAIIMHENKDRKSGNMQYWKYGLITKGGREIVRAQYPCLEESPIPGIYFYGSTSASISNCSGYGLLDSMGREITQPKYSLFTRLNDTTFLCKEAGKYESLNQYLLLTTKGKELLSLKHNKRYFEIAGSDTLLILYTETMDATAVTVYNIHSGLLKENTFRGVQVFNKQKLLLIGDWEFASGSLMTTDGKIIMDKIQTHTFSRDTSMKGDIPFILVSSDRNKDFKMYNVNTRKIIANDYGFKNDGNPYYSGQFTEGLLPVRQKGKWGFMDTAGKMKLPPIFESAENFHDGWAVVTKKGKDGNEYDVYINKTGKEMAGIKADYLNAREFCEGFAYYKKPYDVVKDFQDDTVYYINKSGKVIYKSESGDFFKHGDFSNGMAAVPNKEKKYGYINTKGELVIPYLYSIPDKKDYVGAIGFDRNGQALVEKEGKKIVIDKTGKNLTGGVSETKAVTPTTVKNDPPKKTPFSPGDITPEAASNVSYIFITTDKESNLYAVKNRDYQTYSALKYNGTGWSDISISAAGWVGVYDFKADAAGNLYAYASPKKDEIHLYKYAAGKWDTIPVMILNGVIRSMYINNKNELYVRGKFNNEQGPFYIAKYLESRWVPVGQTLNNKFLEKAFREYSGNDMAEDEGGNLYVEIFRYAKPESKSYITVWNGKSWTLLDTVKYKMDATIPNLAVTKKGDVFFGGYYKNENGEYSLVKGNSSGWKMVSTKAPGFDPGNLESVAVDNNDLVYAAGWMKKNYEYVVARWKEDKGWESFASCNSYIGSIVTSAKCVYATVSSGKRIFCFTEGSIVKEGQ